MSKTSSAVVNRYKKKTYARINVSLPKALVAEYKEAVAANGENLTGPIRRAIEEYIKK